MVADVLSAVGGVASVVAAGAALVTVVYARATVIQARVGRREAKDAHAEETRQQAQLLEATRTAHEQEIVEREKALASEMFLQRLVHLGRITDLLGDVADVARAEEIDPPPTTAGTMMARLEDAITIFESLGGPPLAAAEKLSREDRMPNTPPMRILGDAMSALDEIAFLARENNSLTQPHSTLAEQEQA
jgi:hypothetical protein